MKLYVLLQRREPSCPLLPSPAICVCWLEASSLPDTEPGLCGGQACGQLGARGDAGPQPPPAPGKAEGKGEAHLASLVPPGAKAIPKPKGKRAADPPCSC